MPGSEGSAGRGAADDDIAGAEADGTRSHRSRRFLRVVYGRVGIRHHVRLIFSRPPEMQVVAFLQPSMMHVVRDTKSDVQSVPC